MKKMPTWLKGLLIVIAVYLFAVRPIPFYIEIPGTAFGLDDIVEVDHKYSDDPGEFYLTTVGIQQVTPMTALTSLMPYRDLLSEQELFGDIQDFEAYDVIQQFFMDSSGNTAIQVAFDAADMPYELEYNGVYVLQVLKDSEFFETLKVGDTVKSVDGLQFESSHDFIEYISNLTVDDTIEIAFERDGEMHVASGSLILLESGVPGIGIGLVDNTTLLSDPEVEIHSGAIGGPSAGLMLSLQIYNQLVEGNLHEDYDIAGTGTIAPDGTVGRIGGIEKKVVAADDAGADYFLAPVDEITEEMLQFDPNIQTNYEAAAETAADIETEMEVIPVKTFEEALEFLEQLEPKQASNKQENIFSQIDIPFYLEKEVAIQ